ncbi:ABC transporter thiamine pyrophosphate-binding lipoprotein p37/Cypl [Mycoplasma nasistruthionis]|uniref:High affinity transport system protein p37 n=1 Tax=Mycoplasma nasistruthionis TaxID=353852 RepID=A0A5B7XVB4_9MOLU|nr:hypothetical protein [Mycoplasma nasistruthionis]QCZ36702.1 hypothetical protein FG904_01590 [Mycoplasma nasistruthionis]
MNHLFKKIALTSAPIISGAFVFVSCEQTVVVQEEQEKTYKLFLTTPEWGDVENIKTTLQQQLNNKLVELKSKAKVEIKFTNDTDYATLKENLNKQEADFAFISSGSIYDGRNQKQDLDKLNLKLQSLTRKLKGSDPEAKYQENNNPLFASASNQETYFKAIPWSEQWNDKANGNGWNGAIYTNFYEMNNYVPYQRGLIAIVANEQMTQDIIQAWNNKDLASFIKFGIGIGKSDSGSKYLLPQALFKKHFNKAGQEFLSFDEIRTNTKKYPQATLKQAKFTESQLEKNNDLHIFFANEGEYTWTKFKDSKQYAFAVNNSNPGRTGQKITFLTVTDVLPYNIGVFSKNVSDKHANDISEALIKLASENKDPWGPSVGFNSYKIINDSKTEFWDVVKNTLGE